MATLWRRFFDHPSTAIRDELFAVYTEYARRIALALYKRYANFGVCADDFIQNALLGLHQAIDRYQEAKQVRFETYAAYRIKGEVLNGLTHYSESFDIYRHRKVLERERVEAIMAARGKSNEIQTLLNVALDVVTSSMVELSELDLLVADSDLGFSDTSGLSPAVTQMIARVPYPFHQVLMMHYFYEQSFADIASALGKSKSTVFIMHAKALEILRNQMSATDRELMTV